jgi:transcriptional regulator with XRE-family HTH domain
MAQLQGNDDAVLPVDVLLRAARHVADLSQRELAAAARVDPATVARIESGVVRSPGYRLVQRLLAAAGCQLTAVGPNGAILLPRPYDNEVDRGHRLWPAHLKVRPVVHMWDWWMGFTRTTDVPLPAFTADWRRLRGRSRGHRRDQE